MSWEIHIWYRNILNIVMVILKFIYFCCLNLNNATKRRGFFKYYKYNMTKQFSLYSLPDHKWSKAVYVCATTAALIKITLTWFDPITLIYFLYYFAIAAFLPWLAAFFTTYSIVSNGSRSCGVGLCKNRLMHVTT